MSNLSPLFTLITLILLEILLSADNAVVLGVLCHPLPKEQRKKALLVGLLSAFILRAAALLSISYLFKETWIQFLGATYLVYLSLRYLTKKRTVPQPNEKHSFWKTVLLIEMIDIVFAIDSILAGIAFINGDQSLLWIVYLGGMIGLVSIRYAADLFSRLLDRFCYLEKSAYLIVGWVGLKLGFGVFHLHIPSFVFWALTSLFFMLGFFNGNRLKSDS